MAVDLEHGHGPAGQYSDRGRHLYRGGQPPHTNLFARYRAAGQHRGDAQRHRANTGEAADRCDGHRQQQHGAAMAGGWRECLPGAAICHLPGRAAARTQGIYRADCRFRHQSLLQ
ncbi:hypothetical protein D3C78_1612230 [compost metagenome]